MSVLPSALLDRVSELAAEGERLGTLPPDLVEAFQEEGLFRLALPKSLGGREQDVASILATIEEVSRADGSAGWSVMISATSGIVAAYLAPEVASTMFDARSIVCGVIAPKGAGTRAGDGYVVNGRWPFTSGCRHADWMALACIVDGSVRSAIVPAADVEICDTWHVSGLRGTGSNDVAVTDAFVPDTRWFSLAEPVQVDTPLYRFPLFCFLGLGVAAVALGIGRRAIDELIALAGAKTPAAGRRTLAERTTMQADVSRAEALVSSAGSYVYATVERAWDAAERGEVTVDLRRDLRLATTNAARACADAVDLCYDAGGGTSIYESSALQRCFRDIHALTQHMVVSPSTYELTGRLLFGLETDTSTL